VHKINNTALGIQDAERPVLSVDKINRGLHDAAQGSRQFQPRSYRNNR
jgi:hypothetical protein